MSLKRKAAHASVLNMDTPDSKRRKGPQVETPAPAPTVTETLQRTTKLGLEFLQKLRTSQDKHGALIAKHFETLPDRDEYPDYYETITLPISIGSIEEKLKKQEYPNMSAVEADLKRMIKNAKQYNDKSAEAYNDAEKIRKMMSNTMKQINPAYADPAYSVDATPDPATPITPAPANTASQQTPSRPKRSLTLNGPKNPVEEPTPQDSAAAPAGEDFEGKTFQQAQEILVSELIDLKDDDDVLVSANFLDKPPRSLKDYYETIKQPQSLNIIRKQVQGWVSLKLPRTGMSNYKSWAEFEDAVSLIWKNARQYNVDGSEIVQYANQIEEHFNKRLAQARAAIPEQAAPKIKLKVSAKSPDPPAPKLTLHAPKTEGVAVDEGALRRQQELVRAGTGATPAAKPTSSADNNLPTGSTPAPSETPAKSASPSSTPNGLTASGPPQQARMDVPVIPPANGGPASMPPPPPLARPGLINSLYHSNLALTELALNRFRPPGKDENSAILGKVLVQSHPQITGILEHERFEMGIAPHHQLSQQSRLLKVSPKHIWLQVTTFKKQVDSTHTLYLYCFVNGRRVEPIEPKLPHPNALVAPNQKVIWTIPLAPGDWTKVEIQAIANPIRGARQEGNSAAPVGFEFERVTLLVQRELDPPPHHSNPY